MTLNDRLSICKAQDSKIAFEVSLPQQGSIWDVVYLEAKLSLINLLRDHTENRCHITLELLNTGVRKDVWY